VARKANNLTSICEPIIYKIREPRRLTTLWASTACYRDSFTFYLFFFKRTGHVVSNAESTIRTLNRKQKTKNDWKEIIR
jgi:hypothetical protein